MNPHPDDQLRILRAINETSPVTPDEATWAVSEGYAVQAEDGDIDLTSEGRQVIRDPAR